MLEGVNPTDNYDENFANTLKYHIAEENNFPVKVYNLSTLKEHKTYEFKQVLE